MGSSFFCLSSKFIDGRLELLNSGRGFSDVFEEEINMGEYAGKKESALFHGGGPWSSVRGVLTVQPSGVHSTMGYGVKLVSWSTPTSPFH